MVIEENFRGYFDYLHHRWFMKQISNFKSSYLIKKWMKTEYVERKVFHRTKESTRQGKTYDKAKAFFKKRLATCLFFALFMCKSVVIPSELTAQ
ncbi:hypothetical protein RYX51_22295 (plasmid) [Priestia filamentosa]|nr:hypothetical protein RYX51_22295 [Priestia filamentosa]